MNPIASTLLACQVPKPNEVGPTGNDLPNVIRTEKGRFPADLNRLRGNLVLEASVGDPLIVMLEVGAANAIVAACDDADFYGIWHNGQWKPQTSDQLYGSAFNQVIQSLFPEGPAAGTWLATFAHRTPIPTITTTTTNKEDGAVPTAAAAATVVKKKTVVRKRPLATPAIGNVIPVEETATAPKKVAAAASNVIESEDQVDLE